jgi:hypothetical protein
MRKIDAFFYAAGIIGVGLIAYAWPVQAAECELWPALKDQLAAEFHEVEQGGGFISDQAVVVVLASPGGETWSMVILRPDGYACPMAAGRDWFQRSIPSADERPS